jgi:hypothetical protein
MRSGPSKPFKLAVWASTLPALLAACFFYYPWAFSGPVVCPMPLVLGIPCPGCGITRAFGLALHGHLGEAYAFHPLWPLLLAYFAFLWIYQLVETARGAPPRLDTSRISAVACIAIVWFWLLRLAFFFAQGGLQVVAHDNLLARLARWLSP